MSTNGNSSGGGSTGPSGTERAWPDTIDFVYDHGTEGDLAANDSVRGNGWTDVVGDNSTETNEIIEIERVELIPPENDDGSLQQAQSIRLWDGENYYPRVRMREFMLGYFGQDYPLSSPSFGTPVLSGEASPGANPIATATPKYGTSTNVSPAFINDGTPVTDSFRIRLHVWRWRGTESELQSYLSAQYGTTTFQQNISISNPFTGSSQTYTRSNPVRIQPGADGGALGQFTELTGGINQSLPKVYPWFTWTANNNATEANRPYKFTTATNRVDQDWKRLEFDFTDREKAVMFDTVQVNQPDNLSHGVFSIAERDNDPEVQLTPDSAHELPVLRPLDGTDRSQFSPGQIPVDVADRFGGRQTIWDDGGGFRVYDDGNSIAAGDILVGVTGRYLELTS